MHTYKFLKAANVWLLTFYELAHPEDYRAAGARTYNFVVGDCLEVSPGEASVRGSEWVVSMVNFKYKDRKPFNEKDAISYMSNIELSQLVLDGVLCRV